MELIIFFMSIFTSLIMMFTGGVPAPESFSLSSKQEEVAFVEGTYEEEIVLPTAYVSVEVGTESEILEHFLTQEEISTVGGVYNIEMKYADSSFDVRVEIVDTEDPIIYGVESFAVACNDTVTYLKNVTAYDNSREDILVEVDTSNVDLSTPGIYPLIYTATDSSGNTAMEQAFITVKDGPVYNEEYVRPLVENVVGKVVKADMSDYDKAYVLYQWCVKNLKVTESESIDNTIWEAAYEGLTYGGGNYYTCSGTYSALLTVAGVDNMLVDRKDYASAYRWNLVNTGDGWYHCDVALRDKANSYVCFMQTDKQVQEYATTKTDNMKYFTFDQVLYPERATNIIFGE